MATKRALERQLSVVAGFDDPSVRLEQYRTPPELAAHVVHIADLQGDVEGRTILDLGTGTGMLALGSALRSPRRVVGVELDRGALDTARDNERRVGAAAPVDWVVGDVERLPLSPPADADVTVLMNPPFGAQNGRAGADRTFLSRAADLSRVSYSIHNAGSREFVEAFAADNGGTVTHAYAASFAVDRQFDHHTSDREELDVEVFRVEW